MCNIGQVGEGTRVGIPRIAAHSTARTFTGYVGSSQGTREHRFLIVSVPDTRRSCHVILHCTEESESEGGQVDFHRTLDRRSPSRTTILPIRYQIYWKLGRLRILFVSFSQLGILGILFTFCLNFDFNLIDFRLNRISNLNSMFVLLLLLLFKLWFKVIPA